MIRFRNFLRDNKKLSALKYFAKKGNDVESCHIKSIVKSTIVRIKKAMTKRREKSETCRGISVTSDDMID